jgi:hypothetical protein
MHLNDLRYMRLDFLAGRVFLSASVIFNDISAITITINVFCGGRRGENSFEGLPQVRHRQIT